MAVRRKHHSTHNAFKQEHQAVTSNISWEKYTINNLHFYQKTIASAELQQQSHRSEKSESPSCVHVMLVFSCAYFFHLNGARIPQA